MVKQFTRKYNDLPIQVKASLWYLICSFMQKGISTITTPIFTRLLTTEEYGQFNVFSSWLGIVAIFVTLNIGGGIYAQGLIKFEDVKNEFASSLQGLTTILVLGWSVVYFCFMDWWNEIFSLTTTQMISMFIMIWTSAIWGYWAAKQRVDYNYKHLVILTILVSIAKPVIGIICVTVGDDKVTARIVGLVLVEIVAYSGLFVQQMKEGKKFFSKHFWRYAISLSIPLIPHYLSQIVLAGSDRIMIQKMVGSEEAGIYSLAYGISQVMMLFNTAMSQTISPWMFRKIKDKKIQDMKKVIYITLGIVAVMNLMLIMFAPEVVAIFAPEEYYDAIWVIPPIAMSIFFIFCYDLFAMFEFYYEKTKFIAFASVLGGIVNVVLNYFLISKFGYYAAGYTTLICYIIYAACHYQAMKLICRDHLNNAKPFEIGTFIGIASLFIICGFILLVTYNYPILRYSIIIVVMIITICFHKKIIEIIKNLLELKREK